MDKKEMKKQYLLIRLQDPDVNEWEKRNIRQQLGIFSAVSADDILNKAGFELRRFVSDCLDEQMCRIRREKRTNRPSDFLSENLKAIDYLCAYDAFLEDDCFISHFDNDADLDEINGLIKAFDLIGRSSDAQLIKSALKKKKYSDIELEKLQEHFWRKAENEIETAIENFIKTNVQEIIALCKI